MEDLGVERARMRLSDFHPIPTRSVPKLEVSILKVRYLFIQEALVFSGRARAVLLAALSLTLAGLFAPTAFAAVTESSIAEPSDSTFTLADTTVAPTSLTVTGTTVGSGNVDINCYTAFGHTVLASNVVPTGNTFTTTISPSESSGGPCVLRAVLVRDTTEYAPGRSEFYRPRLAGSFFEPYENSSDKATYGYVR